MKKKICWLTGPSFTETDLNYNVMKDLSVRYEIHWFVIGTKNNYFSKEKFDVFKTIPDFFFNWEYNRYRMRDPRSILFYYRLLRKIRALTPEVVYCNIAPDPWFAIISLLFNRDKTVFAAHDGKVQNDSSSFGLMRTFAYNTLFNHSKFVNMFSLSQADLMRETYPNNKIHTMSLPLKDFGKVKENKPKDFVRFLSFGFIIYQKNIDLLIDAAELLYSRGYRNFKVSINGACNDWKYYLDKIKHEEIFECTPRFLSNDELLRLFATSHYSIFPYRRVSQSGVLKLAFNYNLPVITSNIGAFKEEVKENVNGYFFEVENVTSLADIMEKCLNMKDCDYIALRERMKQFTDNTYSTSKIVGSYSELFSNFLMRS